MILKVDTLLMFFVLSVNADINITTNKSAFGYLNLHGIDIYNSTNIYFKVKTCYTANIVLHGQSTDSGYRVIFARSQMTIRKINSGDILYGSKSCSGMDCNCYVSLWISWIDEQITVGKGTRIGTDVCYRLPDSSTSKIIVTDIHIHSFTAAYWLFAFPENTTSDCTTNGLDGASGIGPETINTTETTLPGLVLTTISKTETTTSGFDPTSINTTETTTSGFDPTSIDTTETTTSGFDPTSINTTETTTSGFDPTSISTTETTTPGFAPTSINITVTTTSDFFPISINTTASSTPGLYPTSINTSETTTPGFFPTTISTTETTSTGYNPTTISETETTTSGFAPISIGLVTATTSGTTTNIETTSIKKSCICPCNNIIMTEDELIKKIALLRSELSVDPKLTSKYRRSLISAADDRPSSKYIGTVGIVILVVICSLIVLMDFQHYARVIFQKKNY